MKQAYKNTGILNEMRISCWVLTLIVFSFCRAVAQQGPVPNMARVAGKGIIVFAGDKIPTTKGKIKGYRIERKAAGESDFRQVAELKATASFDEFKDRAAHSSALVPYPVDLTSMDLQSMWDKRTGELRSLGMAGMSLAVLNGFNMIWLDASVQDNTAYQYRVTTIAESQSTLSEAVTYKKNFAVNALHFSGYSFTQQGVEMKWFATGANKPAVLQVYRNENRKMFAPLEAKTFVSKANDTAWYYIADRSARPKQVYQYYINAYDAMGNLAPVADTAFLASLSYAQTALPDHIKTISDTVKRGIAIRWKLHDAAVIKMLTLYRSTNSLSGFKPIATLAATDTAYLDQRAMPAVSYFYYFEVVDKMDTKPKQSITFAGKYQYTGKPPVARNVAAKVTGSTIEISWDHSGELTNGFWVFRCQPGDKMRQVSGFIPCSGAASAYKYIDSTAHLSDQVFYDYAIKAVSVSDVNGNFSDTVRAKPITITKPAAPADLKLVDNGSTISLFWDNMRATDPNIAGYIVMKSRAGSAVVDTILSATNFITDTLVKPGTGYVYRVSSVSMFGAKSEPSRSVTRDAKTAAILAPSALRADHLKDGVLVAWELPAAGDKYKYNIYRYTNGDDLQKIGSVDNSSASFTDKNVTKGNRYSYMVRSENDAQKESANSAEVSIRYE